jgi:LPXTG-motif cell wall-anchored protein
MRSYYSFGEDTDWRCLLNPSACVVDQAKAAAAAATAAATGAQPGDAGYGVLAPPAAYNVQPGTPGYGVLAPGTDPSVVRTDPLPKSGSSTTILIVAAVGILGALLLLKKK